MAIDKVGAVGGASAPVASPGRGEFGKVLEGLKGPARPPVATEAVPRPVAPERGEAVRGPCEAREGRTTASAGPVEARGVEGVDAARSARSAQAVRMLDRVSEAQRRLDEVLARAESGRTFSPAELLAVQAHVYRASQELDLAGKVVEKATGGVKQVLQTQV